MPRDIMAALERSVLVCEGGMRTALSARGVTAGNASEANLTHPELVAEVHHSFMQAGAEVFLTNTFAANPLVLERAGLRDAAPLIWASAVRICREAVGPEAFVCATAGPTGEPPAPGVRDGYRRQFEAMLGPDVDCILLEGFDALEEAEAAVRGARDVDAAIPLAVTLSFREPASQAAAARLCEHDVQIIGVGCGPAEALEAAFREMAQDTDRALMARPDAGATTPVEMGRLAARLIACGARIVGGCCGTTPEHVAHIARAAGALP